MRFWNNVLSFKDYLSLPHSCAPLVHFLCKVKCPRTNLVASIVNVWEIGMLLHLIKEMGAVCMFSYPIQENNNLVEMCVVDVWQYSCLDLFPVQIRGADLSCRPEIGDVANCWQFLQTSSGVFYFVCTRKAEVFRCNRVGWSSNSLLQSKISLPIIIGCEASGLTQWGVWADWEYSAASWAGVAMVFNVMLHRILT